MQYSRLGNTDIKISRVCLGSMTWGLQNNQQDANQQIDFALDQGVNFIDTAELYAVPPSPETYGKTEEIIGHWLAANARRRKDIILATKIAGAGLSWIRGGEPITKQSVISAVDDSLQRLQTDYIDLYQIHWPNRRSPHFAKHWPNQLDWKDAVREQEDIEMMDILLGLQTCIESGKIRHVGLSDETPWGIANYLRLSREHNLPRPASIQNEFSLIHAKDWPYLIEQCAMEDIAYLPWSPLAGGVLTGKYLNGARPKGSRWTLSQRNGLFRDTPHVEKAVAAYKTIADKHSISLATLSLAWCNHINGVSSTIIGATHLNQLKENIEAFELKVSEALSSDILELFKQHSMPF